MSLKVTECNKDIIYYSQIPSSNFLMKICFQQT